MYGDLATVSDMPHQAPLRAISGYAHGFAPHPKPPSAAYGIMVIAFCCCASVYRAYGTERKC